MTGRSCFFLENLDLRSKTYILITFCQKLHATAISTIQLALGEQTSPFNIRLNYHNITKYDSDYLATYAGIVNKEC